MHSQVYSSFVNNTAIVANDVCFSVHKDIINNSTPSPHDCNFADDTVHLITNGVGTRGLSPLLDRINDNYFDIDSNLFNLDCLDHLFSCSLIYCVTCVNIGTSLISFIHHNLGFIQLGPFLNPISFYSSNIV
jgi:hypothetical protein